MGGAWVIARGLHRSIQRDDVVVVTGGGGGAESRWVDGVGRGVCGGCDVLSLVDQ